MLCLELVESRWALNEIDKECTFYTLLGAITTTTIVRDGKQTWQQSTAYIQARRRPSVAKHKRLDILTDVR